MVVFGKIEFILVGKLCQNVCYFVMFLDCVLELNCKIIVDYMNDLVFDVVQMIQIGYDLFVDFVGDRCDYGYIVW